MPSYTVNEPHPTVPQNSYTHSGRGGAGNTFRVSSTTSPSGVPTQVMASPPVSGRFYSGRGGAGNAHEASERHALSFDQEYVEATRQASAASGHVGRGGAGNVYSGTTKTSPSVKKTESRRDSASTNGSERSGFWGRLSTNSRH